MMREDGVWGGAARAPCRDAKRTRSARGERELKVRVKTGKGRSLSSKLWLERQLNDPYVARAKREGFRSRAAFKLIEIDDKHHLLKPGARVVDLGAAPGGWSQVAAQARRRGEGRGRVVAIDILADGADRRRRIRAARFPRSATRRTSSRPCSAAPADVVLSDMAANATGHRQTDHLRIMALVEAAAEFAARGAEARRRVSRQGAAGRHRGDAAGRAQARLRQREARQAGGEPRRIRPSSMCWRPDFAGGVRVAARTLHPDIARAFRSGTLALLTC